MNMTKENRMKKTPIRVTADFDPAAYEVLQKLAIQLAGTKAEALRKSLGLMKYFVEEREKGGRIFIENSDGSKRKELITL